MKAVGTLLALGGLTTAVQGRMHKSHARSMQAGKHNSIAHSKRDGIESGVAYEALVGYGYQDGAKGACGEVSQDTDYTAGIATLSYNGDMCGECVEISTPEGNSVTAQLKDSCDPAKNGDLCHGYYDMFLSVAAFEDLTGDLDYGIVNATWTLADCSGLPQPKAQVSQSQSQDKASYDKNDTQPPSEKEKSQPPPKESQWQQPAQSEEQAQPSPQPEAQDQAPSQDTQQDQQPSSTPEAQPEPSSTPQPSSSNNNDGIWPSTKYGVAWGMNNQAASSLAGGVISSYMHWKDPEVPGLDAMYMPMYELSNDYYGQLFNQVINDMSSPPTVLLGQNEIDNDATYADPGHAADMFRRYVTPHGGDNTVLCSPSIVYDIDQLKQFMDSCQDCGITCLQLHVYRPVSDDMASDAQQWLQQAHSELGNMDVVVSEIGIDTRNGSPSEDQTIGFMRDMAQWAAGQDWIKTLQWSGGFSSGTPWDSFLGNANALLTGGGNAFDVSGVGNAWKWGF